MPRKKQADEEQAATQTEWDVMATESSKALLKLTMAQMKWRAPQVAAALDCSDDVVRRWLRGERRIQVSDLIRLAQISGADLNEVFGLPIHGGQPNMTREEVQAMIRTEVQDVLGKILVSGYDVTQTG
jgi:transcriptional regulator with XRE-family HTH domain